MEYSQILNFCTSSPRQELQRLTKKFDFKDIKFPVKIRDIHKIEKTVIWALVFFCYKEKHTIPVSKKWCEEKHVDLSLIVPGKGYYLPIKDFDTFMYDHTLNHGKNNFVIIAYKLLVQKKY